MPRQAGEFQTFGYNTLEEQLARRDGGQAKWYETAGRLVKGYTVMDVGAGNGYGMKIMKDAGALMVRGVDPSPAGPVEFGYGEDIHGYYDWITCFDVIEHVEDTKKHPHRNDKFFLVHLISHARVGVFLSTPNWDVYGCGNPLHYREYTPDEMRDLLNGLDYDIWHYTSGDLDSPRRVESFEECVNFGVVIWKVRPIPARL